MKRIALTLCTALCCLLTNAGGLSLYVTLNDGQRVEFALDGTPEVTMDGGQLTITTPSTTASYDLWTVGTLTYGAATAIRQAATAPAAFTLSGDRIVADGMVSISVATLDGKAVSITPTRTADQTAVSLSSLPKGIYAVNINGTTVKITRR